MQYAPSAADQFQLILIFSAVIIGALSATYFYQTTDAFPYLLKRPLRIIVSGLVIMAVDVLLAAFIMYESRMGLRFTLNGVPLEAFFFVLYILGSILISVGARRLIVRPE